MSKIEKLREFLKRPPKGWDSFSRKDKIAAAAKASGMTPGSVSVAVSTNPDLRSAFGTSARKRSIRSAKPRRPRAKAPSQPGTVLAAKNAIDLLGFDDLLDVSRYLRRALEKRMDAGKKEIRAYR